MSPCADSLFYFFTSYSHIRILSLRTPLIRFFQCRLVRIHCFTFSHRIPTFEFFLLGPRSLVFPMSPCADSLFYFFTSYYHIRILSLRTPLIRFFQCRLVRIHCFTFSHRIPTFEFFLFGPRSLDFSNVVLYVFIVLLFLQHIPTFEFFLLGPRYSLFYFFYIIFPHSNSFS